MKPAVPSEELEQTWLVSWLTSQGYSFWAFSPDPNTTPARRAKRQRMGLRPGFPDLMVILKNGRALAIEMKRQRGGTTSSDQKNCLALLEKAGIMTVVCKGFESAKAAVTERER